MNQTAVEIFAKFDRAAKALCMQATLHPIECPCEMCFIAMEVFPHLERIAESFREQFERRLAVHELLKARENTEPNVWKIIKPL